MDDEREEQDEGQSGRDADPPEGQEAVDATVDTEVDEVENRSAQHDAGDEGDPSTREYNPVYPPGEDTPTETADDGIPMKSIADEVKGDEETEDMTDVESGDA